MIDKLEYTGKLNEEYEYIFHKIILYLESSTLPSTDCRSIIDDIFHYLLMKQKDSKSIEEAMGENYKEFCNEVVKESIDNKKSKIRIIANRIYYLLLVLSSLATLKFIASVLIERILINHRFSLLYNVTLGDLLSLLLILFSVYFILSDIHNTAFENKKRNAVKSFVIYSFLVLIFLVYIYLISLLSINKVILFSLNGIFMLVILYISAYFYKLICNKL